MTSNIACMHEYREKADFFDQQVEAPWAAKEYTPAELSRLEDIRQEVGDSTGKQILEPGCGSGRLTEILCDWVGEKGLVHALDVSGKMVKLAKTRLAGKNNVLLEQNALENLAVQNGGYDIVFHHQVFPHYNDKGKALDITARLLNPGGRIVIHHFINIEEINNVHRKAGTVVERDTMPESIDMHHLFHGIGFKIKYIINNENGYLLSAVRAY